MKKKNTLIWIVAVCLLLAAAYTIYAKYKPSGSISQSQTSKDKIMAPEFTLKDLDGNSATLSDYKGKIVVLNFWAVWCKYCIQEMPDLNELGKQLEKDGDAVILAIDSEEAENKVRDYVNSANINLKVLLDTDGKVTSLYGIQGFPTTFILNPDGTLYTYISGATNKETLLSIVEKIRNGEPVK